MAFCPSCGDEIQTDWDFCLHCGEDLSELDELAASGSGTAAPDTPQSDTNDSQLLPELNRAEFKQKIRKVSPYEFEELVGDIWQANGREVEVSQQSQDRGIDITAQRGDETELIQVKRYNVDNTVGSNEVRKYATLYQQESDVDSVVIVTASSFTSQAENLATDLGINAVDSDELYEMVQGTDIEATVLESTPETRETSTPVEEFVAVYQEFLDVNTDVATKVFNPASSAADHDGAEAQFARRGGEEQLRFAIQMRNEWAEIITHLDELAGDMEPFPERIPQAEFSRLISEQVQTMHDLSEAYKRGLKYKDRLINSRFEGAPLTPGTVSQVAVPDAPILQEPIADVEDLKQDQDVCMTIAAKETDKIGDLSDERTRLIESVKDRA